MEGHNASGRRSSLNSDGRVVMVELTDQGRQLMRRRRKRVREGYQKLFDKLSGAERDSFLGSLRNLDELLTKVTD